MNGPRGQSRIKVPAEFPWTEGWHDFHDVFPEDVHSLGIEAIMYLDSTPVAPSTWGRIKSIFR